MRYPYLSPEEMTPRQHLAAETIKTRRGALSDPYLALLYAPDVADLSQTLWHHLRFDLRLPERLRLMAVLMTAGRHDSADTDLFLHSKDLDRSGLSAEKIKALSEGRRPQDMSEDEEMVHDFCTQLLKTGRVTNVTFDRVVGRFDRQICLELTTVCAHTAVLTTMLKVTRTRFADGEPAC